MFREFDFENRPIVEIVDEILADANKLGASDIHFDPTPDSLNIRVRIDGELREYTKVPDAVKKNLLTRVKIISGMNITETRLPQDGAITHHGGRVEVRGCWGCGFYSDFNSRFSDPPFPRSVPVWPVP